MTSHILLDGEVVHYVSMGRGRPVIFLHGWLGSWRYWLPALDAASAGYHTYALDFWGFGDTWKDNKSRYTLAEQKTLLVRFIAEMGLGRVALVGHGLGALISLFYALDPEKSPTVDRLMLVSSPLGINSINPRLRKAAIAELVEWLLARDPAYEPVRTDALKSDPLALTTFFNDIGQLNVQLNQIRQPTLLVHGQNDPAISPASVEFAPQNVHQIIFEHSGHFPMLDETNKFNHLLLDWLELDSGESPHNLHLKEEHRRVR